MNQDQTQKTAIYSRLSLFSIIAAVFGILCCCNPPLQLIFGAAAVIFAWLSKNNQPFSPRAMIGIILGSLCILFSFIVFFQYMWAINFVDDPANASLIKEVYRQTQEILNSMGETAN